MFTRKTAVSALRTNADFLAAQSDDDYEAILAVAGEMERNIRQMRDLAEYLRQKELERALESEETSGRRSVVLELRTQIEELKNAQKEKV